MTCKTRDAVGRSELRVGIPDELNHFASGLLLRFIILLKLVFYMAISAVDAERRLERKHNLHQPIRGNSSKQLDVLILLLSTFVFAPRRKRIEGGKLGWGAGWSTGFGSRGSR